MKVIIVFCSFLFCSLIDLPSVHAQETGQGEGCAPGRLIEDSASPCEMAKAAAAEDDLGLYFTGSYNPRFNTRIRLLKEVYGVEARTGPLQSLDELDCYNEVMYQKILDKYGQDAFERIESMLDSLYQIDEGDRTALFVGGEDELLKYIYCDIDDQLLSHKVKKAPLILLRFTIDQDGSLAEKTIVRKYNLPENEQPYVTIALRKMEEMPKWKPAIIDARPTEVDYHLPIKFNKMTKVKACTEMPGF